ncbi:MAG: serine/threonine protein kinase with Chase2 sensor [Promethearchaeota archaeon CR_4]|nr:MAG: serine/threonine protein kinase with Chase2 sensor [Candidatus Lokiarchaeota archaeon CR_4]
MEMLELEFVNGENLQKFTVDSNLLPLARIVLIIEELASILAYLHQHGIIYMDIKAKNVLVLPKGIKLLDFGMTQFIDRGREPKGTVYSLLSTPEYVPPEMATTFSATSAADVFQLGILFYQLVAGCHPFARVAFTEGDAYRESEQLKYALANVYVQPNFQHPRFSECGNLTDILKLMLNKNPQDRPTANDVTSLFAKWSQAGGIDDGRDGTH